uniref:Uncharacterized protein n=1 Tax=Salix viminalis TaxID=40686 RepID=A0A6N2KC25_SALVM
MQVSVQQVNFLDYPYLQDGYGSSWDLNLLKEEVSSHGIDKARCSVPLDFLRCTYPQNSLWSQFQGF